MAIIYWKIGVERIYEMVCMSNASQTVAGVRRDIGIMCKTLSQICKKVIAVKILLHFTKPHIQNVFRSFSEIQKSSYRYFIPPLRPLRVKDA
jgi:hypothetical protein